MCLSTSVPAAARQAGGMAPPPPFGLFAGIAEFSALSLRALQSSAHFLGLADHLDARLLEDKRFCGEALRSVVAITCKSHRVERSHSPWHAQAEHEDTSERSGLLYEIRKQSSCVQSDPHGGDRLTL